MRARFGARKFIAYFQAFTNTYAPLEVLRHLYDSAVDFPDVVGLSVGTRPDCVPEPVLDLLEEYRHRGYVQVELGLESVRDDSLRWMNRCHSVEEFRDAVRRTRNRGLEICTHLIFGLPREGHREAVQAADEINSLEVEGVKIHMLHVLRHSPLEKTYAAGRLSLLDRESYVSLVVDHLERLRPDVVIHRLTGEAPPHRLIAPHWCLDKNRVLEGIREEIRRRKTWQRKLYRLRGTPEAPVMKTGRTRPCAGFSG
ncbi:MAG: TIGR01212 family radical SAM protein [Acidobacteriota bacterium]